MKKIVLIEAHEDGGRVYPPGSELTLSDAEVDWLISAGKASTSVSTLSNSAKAAPTPKATEFTADKEQEA